MARTSIAFNLCASLGSSRAFFSASGVAQPGRRQPISARTITSQLLHHPTESSRLAVQNDQTGRNLNDLAVISRPALDVFDIFTLPFFKQRISTNDF